MILIVDDDNAVRLAIRLALDRAGIPSEAVGTEPEAMELVRRPEVQLVVLDMNLTLTTTGRQGLEMLRKIRVLRPGLPVLLITAWGTIPLSVDAMKLGATDFLTKPWSNADLVAKIKSALAKSAPSEPDAPRSLEDVERETIRETLRRCGGNLSDAARLLGITRQSLYRRIQKLGL